MTANSLRFKGLALAAVALLAASACSSSATPAPTQAPVASTGVTPTEAPAATTSHKAVTISVGALRPGATQEAVDALNLQISEFEATEPWVTVESQEYNWTAPTFTAQLQGGTLPTVFTIPFTDGKGLIQQHQIVNIDSRVKKWDFIDKFNKGVLVNGEDANGAIWAVPTQAYGMSLTYNRTLFTAAGLDPEKPPTTWAEVKAAAKAIQDKTGMAGYAEMADHNTGGWQLTTATYALGGRMETVDTTKSPAKVTATVNNDATKAALAFLHDLRWNDNSMGATFNYDWGSINAAFAAGQIGMFTGGSDLYTAMVQNNKLKPADYGITVIPTSGANSGVLGGGTLAAVNVLTTEVQRDAAVDWINFYYMQKLLTEKGALADANALVANKQPVGVPALPIFDKATYDQSQVWIKALINVPTAQMTPFTSKIFDSTIIPEPQYNTQDLYANLDPVVQAVLTNKNADINALLDAANVKIQKIIDTPAS
jgi:multiple sugar transport system substrate-binding protein